MTSLKDINVRPMDPHSMGLYGAGLGALLGGGIGAAGGALTAGKGKRRRNALTGALLGAGLGGVGGYGFGNAGAAEKRDQFLLPLIQHDKEKFYGRMSERSYLRDLYQKARGTEGINDETGEALRKHTPGRMWGTDESFFGANPHADIMKKVEDARTGRLADVVGNSSKVPLLDMLQGKTTPDHEIRGNILRGANEAKTHWPDQDMARRLAEAYAASN